MAKKSGYPLIKILDREQLIEILMESVRSLVLWDVDHPNAHDPYDNFSVHNIGQILAEFSSPVQVFAISTKPFSELPYLSNRIFFGHFFLRRYDSNTLEVFLRIIELIASKCDPFGIHNYLEPGTQITRIQIKNASHKKAAVTAIIKVLQKKKVPDRFAALIAHGTDELLLNSIFGSKPARSKVEFSLAPEKQVDLELGVASTYLAIGISDQFGLVQREALQNFLRKNYQKVQYEAMQELSHAGIGIYGIIKSGLSMIFVSDKKSRNQSILIAPLIINFKDFRNSLRFFSFISPA